MMSLRDYLFHEEPGITLYCGDCREVLPLLGRGMADLVLTDPPYNAGKDYGQHDDAMLGADYVKWCRDWFDLTRDVCCRTIIFPGNGNLPVWWEINKPSAVGCWYKPGNSASSVIGWEEWEPWLYWTGDKGLLGGSSVIKAAIGKQPDTGNHPCPKPVVLFQKLLIKTKSAAVLDPFCGSGTALVAAKNLGRRAIGIEIEPKYCEIAVKRLRQEVLL